jgi:hypothetical protein
MTTFKSFKTLRNAREYAGQGPIVQVGNLYLAAPAGDLLGAGLTEVSLIGPRGHVTGSVTLRHLERLGNANHAEAKRAFNGDKLFNAEMFK